MRKYIMALLAICFMGVSFLLIPQAFAEQKYPGEHWEKALHPEQLGYSSEKLNLAKEQFERMGSAAVMVVVDGLVLAEWGDTARHFRAHSMRKSLLNAIFGIHVHQGRINLDATLEEIGIDDNEPLTAAEKQATIRHLLKGRSGIYLPALSLGGSLDNPLRGSHPPGTFFHYNNWDFNVLAAIFEQQTGTKIFEEFKKCIADPLQMEDFQVEDCLYHYGSHSDNVNTRYPAYPFRISAQDLARFGLMYLRKGKWHGQQILPEEWIKESWTPYSVYFGEKTRYCYTNWKVYLKGKRLAEGMRLEDRVYWTSGIGVHRLYIVPWANLVLVHRINSDLPLQRPGGGEVDRLLALILEARISNTGLALVKAVDDGDFEVVEALLDCGADIHFRDELRQTALHYAARRDNTRIVKLLLEHGADVNSEDMLGRTPLFIAAYRGGLATLQALLNAGADFNAKPRIIGQTPLLIAASYGRQEAVEALLEAGADVNTKGEAYSETGLMMAAVNGDTSTVQILLNNGADIKAATANGRTAMMMAEALGYAKVLELLHDAGAPRDLSAALLPLEAYLPPYVVAKAKQGEPVGSQAALALLGRGREIRAQGETALLFAAMRGNVGIVHELLDRGADVNARDKDGWSGLLLASVNGHSVVVKDLLEKGAGFDAKEKLMGQTALIWAARGGHIVIVKALLKDGADVNARDRFGGSALTRAASRGQTEIVKVLLKAGADINAKENDGDTALLEATYGKHLDTVQTLIKAGADVNDRDTDGRTPLMVAAIRGEKKIVQFLFDAGADINAQDNFGSTALDQAKAMKRESMIEALEKAANKK